MKMPASSTRPLHVTLLLSLLLIVLPSSRALTERETLNQFFADTAGVQWLSRDSWASAAPICSWYGVTCNNPSQDYGVIALELPSNNVARKITPQLYQLPDLKVLSLQGNPIEDASFEGLGLVSEDTTDRGTPSPLELVDLSDCLLIHVDGLRFAADTLTQLRLAKNQLAYFPSDVYSLTMLQELYVNFNPMQGPLSKAIGQLTDLTEFYAYSGSLTGTLPTEIGLLDKVQIFTLANNRFSGTIPSEVNNMLNLEVFSLHGGTAADDATGNGAPAQPVDATGLTGPVPSFARAPRLGKLFLADNALTGKLPDDFLEHNQLIDDYILINLRNNRLTGGIPAVLRVFNQLNIDLVGNQLSEPIPNYMCTRSQWMNGLVNTFGCDAILCHAGSYNEQGQQTSDETPCSACPPAGPSANEPAGFFLGASTCPGARDGPSEVGGGTSTDSGGLPTVDPARVLMNLYLQTDGPRWEQNSGWDILDVFLSTSIDMSQVPLEDVDYCRFYGVFCDGQGNVQILSLANNRLRGTIPPDLFRLNRLVSVDLSFNRIDLDFSRPASQGGGLAVLENAPYLERLKLSHTSITRVDGISQGISLTGLYLDGTDLEQPLPDEIYALTNLDTLHMEAAYLVGNLSTKIGLLSNLKRLNLNENEIGGDLPSELGLLTSCEYLDLSDNDFTGVLPAELNSMSSLWSLRINGARGGLGGRLLAFESLPNVRELELAYNVLTGPVPPNFLAGTDRANPLTVRLTGNNLGGSLPEDLQTFTDFTIEVEDNQITGIPPVLCAQTGWQNGEVGRVPGGCDAILCPPLSWSPHGKASPTLNLLCEDCPGNAFFGETVCESGEVTLNREREILDELFFSTGGRYWNKTQTNWTKPGIPICNREGIDCIGDDQPNSGVYQIFLSNYGLRGTVPTSIYELPSLRRLAISWNPVDVNFAGIGGAASLETVQLSGTKVDSLEGIENASTRLVELHIAKAGIEGAFPPQLLEARSLTALYLTGNRITGRIPSEIGQMNLNLLHLDGNELTGPLPTELGMLSSMIELRLQDNQIMGLIPPELGTMSDLKEFDISQQRGELQLTGPLYPFANNSKLVKLNLSGNSFAGLLPKNFLWSVDRTASIQADLSDNLIAGGIPSEYDAFQQLTINLAQNMIDRIPDVLCDNIGWMGGSPPGVDTCDFILCAPQFASSTGRATVGETCRPCPYAGQAPFFGSTECDIAPLQSERDVLVEFYQAAGGDDWVFNENWNSILNVCTWYGVICTEDFSVVELRLENNHLQNENSDTDIIGLLGRLANLRTIDLKGNSLSLALVGLPATSSLQTLRLSSTSLASLAGVSNARNLTSLHAVDCGLTGAFPEEIFDMQNLVEIYLSFNTLNGTLPSAIGSMQKLEQL
jgi:Leucine-rich repeat (LRR) protein